MESVIRVTSIRELHELLHIAPPKNPLITVVRVEGEDNSMEFPYSDFINDAYTILLREKGQCNLLYGTNHYNADDGDLIFIGPGQKTMVNQARTLNEATKYILCFHPDLIRSSGLRPQIDEYTFFEYRVNEALIVSKKEQGIFLNIINLIEAEIDMQGDDNNDILVSYVEALLNHGKRYYNRQFDIISKEKNDFLIRFEELLKKAFTPNILSIEGIPTVKRLAQELGYSSNYLSDLLKKATGKNTQEHIHEYIVNKAKDLLTGTSDPIGVIAYNLGYKDPTHFSKFFKSKTGVSPAGYRSERAKHQ